MTTGQLADRSVIVTGAASGIGRRAAQRFAEAGARVTLADINVDGVRDAAAELPGAIAVGVDIRDVESVRAMVAATTEAFGGIDVLVNNAMVCGRSRLLDAPVEELRNDFEVNLLGPFLCCQQVLPVMLEAERGVIINLSSVNGLAHLGNEAYSAAKAGVLALTRAIALDYGDRGIRCNAVAPGTVRTEVWGHRLANDPDALERAAQFYPTGRIGEPDDIADALLFLASDAASWISGITLPVDGGLLAGNLAMARGITEAD
ncbi:MAG TPA: glucose 1-dehydrogenase [Candidatus Avipropionibacterium avicola]|uniref:Glucose 1-dehydrogenase n=1 Tax=Candidatus Avipropionibacterium avicola TaxID=2840701 RepID=A0A9D1GXR0_9ACTN|nr:glucose 1-dehydrogenase [Candidatus Avipropionibacterium avicola]